MAKTYYWASDSYSSLDEVNASVESKKDYIDAYPCDFVQVKLLSGTAEDGWLVPSEILTHEQLLVVTDEDPNFYAVSSVHHGDTAIGLTASEMLQEVSRLKRSWGAWVELDTVYVVDDEYPDQEPEKVTLDVDLTGYM